MGVNTDELVKSAQKGDWDAYLKLFFHIKDALYRKAYYITRNHHDSNDAMQESMIKGFQAVTRIEDPQKIYFYLTKIVVNTCYNLVKDNQRLLNIEPEEITVVRNSQSKSNIKLDLERNINKLDEEHRIVLILRFFEDMKKDDIAEILDIPLGTVKSRVYYGLKKLKTLMGGDYHEM